MEGKGMNTLGSGVSQTMRKTRPLPSAWRRSNQTNKYWCPSLSGPPRVNRPSSCFSTAEGICSRLGRLNPRWTSVASSTASSMLSSNILLVSSNRSFVYRVSLTAQGFICGWAGSTPATAVFILLFVIPAGSKSDARPWTKTLVTRSNGQPFTITYLVPRGENVYLIFSNEKGYYLSWEDTQREEISFTLFLVNTSPG